MAKPKKSLVLEVDLASDFYDRMDEAMSDELSVAQMKWRIAVDSSMQDLIIQHAKNQLQTKALGMAKPWQYGDEMISISIAHPHSLKVKIPEEIEKLNEIMLVRKKALWEIAEDEPDGAVDVEDFAAHVEQLIIGWARTAVFYGVGSEA